MHLFLTGKDYNQNKTSMIYSWIRPIDGTKYETLFIGKSRIGMGRIYFNHVIGSMEPVLDTDQIHVTFLEEIDIEKVYFQLVEELKPKYNEFPNREPGSLSRCERCGKEYVVVRRWQRFCKPSCRNQNT